MKILATAAAVVMVVACSKSQPKTKSDCDKFADMELKCAGDLKDLDKAKVDEMREIFKSTCDVKPDPTAADLKDTTSPEAKELAASRVELAAKTACAVKTADCAAYKQCLTAAGLK